MAQVAAQFFFTFGPMAIALVATAVAMDLKRSTRAIASPIIASLSLWALNNIKQLRTILPSELCFCLGHFIILWLIHATVVLLLEEPGIQLEQSSNNIRQKTLKILFNACLIGTSNPAPLPGVKHQPFEVSKSGSAPPSSEIPPNEVKNDRQKIKVGLLSESSPLKRSAFALNRIIRVIVLVAIYSAYQIFKQRHLKVFVSLNGTDFSAEKQIFIRRLVKGSVAPREISIRAWLITDFWFCNFAVLESLYCLLSILFVAVLRVDEPDEWPPLFGNLFEATTVLGFWNKTWHKLVYKTYLTYAKQITLDILRISSGTLMAAFMIRFLVFFFSGTSHLLVSWQLGNRCGLKEELLWYFGNFLVVVIEGFLLSILREVKIPTDTRLSKVVGYLWVFGFHFWSLPKVHFTTIACSE
jgi:Membrane bound O-acyl transferase family